MDNTLLAAGLACVLAAIVGGGLKFQGNEIPTLRPISRILVAVLGIACVLVSQRATLPSPGELWGQIFPGGDSRAVESKPPIACNSQAFVWYLEAPDSVRFLSIYSDTYPDSDPHSHPACQRAMVLAKSIRAGGEHFRSAYESEISLANLTVAGRKLLAQISTDQEELRETVRELTVIEGAGNAGAHATPAGK